jgi:hypothetical protein
LGKEIQNINEVVNFVKETDSGSPDVLHFHEKYKTFIDKAEKSFAFEIKSKKEVIIKKTMKWILMISLMSLRKIEEKSIRLSP